MKKLVLIGMMLSLFTSCQEDTALNEMATQHMLSTTDQNTSAWNTRGVLVEDVEHSVYIQVKNSYLNHLRPVTAFQIEVFTENWGISVFQNSFLLYMNKKQELLFDLPQGNYCATIFSEMDGVVHDFEFSLVRNINLCFEFFGTRWETPPYLE